MTFGDTFSEITLDFLITDVILLTNLYFYLLNSRLPN